MRIGGGGVKYNKCKRLAVLQRGEFILGTRHCGLLVTQLFAAFGCAILKIVTIYRDTKSYDSTVVEVTTIVIVTIPQIIVVFRTNSDIHSHPSFVFFCLNYTVMYTLLA